MICKQTGVLAMQLEARHDYSLLTTLLPRRRFSQVVTCVLEAGVRHVMATDARGTLVKDRWYQSLLPVVSPEQEIVQMLVEERMVDRIINELASAGRLYLTGAGAVYAARCLQAWIPDSMAQAPPDGYSTVVREPLPLKRDLVVICCIAKQGISEGIARAAVNTGAPGPTITFCRGDAVRARLGLLRIAISPDKEFLQVVVDRVDSEAIFESMIAVGKLGSPGMGFIYMMPIDRGINNIRGIYGAARHGATIQQIIEAVDDLKGDTDWRAREIFEASQSAEEGVRKRRYLTGNVRLACVTEGGTADSLVATALKAGAPGVSYMYGREIGRADDPASRTGFKLTREREVLEFVLAPRILEEVRAALIAEADRRGLSELAFYTHDVPNAFTYLSTGSGKTRLPVIKRGASI